LKCSKSNFLEIKQGDIMSDFGATISVRRKDGGAFSEEEFAQIEKIVQSYRETCPLKNSMSKPFLFDVGKTTIWGETEFFEINVVLSDYWGDAKMFEWHKETDVKDAATIAKELQLLLSETYQLRSSFERW